MVPFRSTWSAKAGLSLLAAVIGAPSASAQFSTYGVGCGAAITNEAATLPFLGMRYRLRSAGHAPGSLAIAILGFQQVAFPLSFGPGCFLLARPDATVALPVGGGGDVELALDVPVIPSLIGLTVFDQWLGLDPNGAISMSVGGMATVDNPQLGISAVAPAVLSIGTVVTVTAHNLGTTRPQDLCMGVMAFNPAHGRGLIRVTSITPAGAGADTVTGVVQTLPRDAAGQPVQGVVAIMRGDGNELPPIAGLGGGWGWIGPDLPEAGGANHHSVQGTPDPRTRLTFAVDSGDVVLEVPVASYSGSATTDVHWNAGGKHFDSFLPAEPISGTMNETQLRDSVLLPSIQAKYNLLYPGLLQITATTVNGNPGVRIHMVSGAAVSSVGGSVWI